MKCNCHFPSPVCVGTCCPGPPKAGRKCKREEDNPKEALRARQRTELKRRMKRHPGLSRTQDLRVPMGYFLRKNKGPWVLPSAAAYSPAGARPTMGLPGMCCVLPADKAWGSGA